jgi:hypothetical protein
MLTLSAFIAPVLWTALSLISILALYWSAVHALFNFWAAGGPPTAYHAEFAARGRIFSSPFRHSIVGQKVWCVRRHYGWPMAAMWCSRFVGFSPGT